MGFFCFIQENMKKNGFVAVLHVAKEVYFLPD